MAECLTRFRAFAHLHTHLWLYYFAVHGLDWSWSTVDSEALCVRFGRGWPMLIFATTFALVWSKKMHGISSFCLCPLCNSLGLCSPATAQRRTGHATDGLGYVGFDERTVQADARRGEAGARDGVRVHAQLVLGGIRPRWLGVRHISSLGVAAGGDGGGGDGASDVSIMRLLCPLQGRDVFHTGVVQASQPPVERTPIKLYPHGLPNTAGHPIIV